MTSEVQRIPTGCPHDCGGKCVLIAHVRNGVIERITSDEGEEPQVRACQRGRAYRQRVYHPDRLKYPLKRSGPRGSGQFIRISWDEALDTVAGELLRVKQRYGPEAILCASGPGSLTHLHRTPQVASRFFHMWGGCARLRGARSTQAIADATRYTYGVEAASHDIEDIYNSRLALLWSWNSAETVFGTNTTWHLRQARERGTRMVVIDPRYTDTAALLADQSRYIGIVPGTDAALMVAMAYVMLEEGLADRAFLERYTLGFDQFAAYVLGEADGLPKTPAWAEAITGVPQATIRELARDYATTKPAALLLGFGMQRAAYGEQPCRAGMALAAMTGNIGLPGGSPAGMFQRSSPVPKLPVPPNPVSATIPYQLWAEAFLQGRAGGFETDVQLVYISGNNLLNQQAHINKGRQALLKPETIVVHEQFLTPTARYADIVLPITTHLEREDIATIWHMGHWAIYMNQAIEPMYECRSDLAIFTELAKRLGISGFNDRTDREWLRAFAAEGGIPDFDQLRARGVYHFPQSQPHIAFRKQIADPEHHPFPTPSGKIEIYSPALAKLGHPDVPPIPKYIVPWEGRDQSREHPLQLLSPHGKTTALSTYANIPWVQEVEPHRLWINPRDAATRGIADGDKVRVFNSRGTTMVRAWLTQRIMPGVVSLDHGHWLAPNDDGADTAGSVNVLTRDQGTVLGDGATYHSCLAEVART
ncbi:MAG: molybdopterin-dependent oxidoreductase [Chloroflexi bacterium]|nr:molybdopterin-dependent oxidoreductase [Chloroflexota bacterium]